jgi:hypothetical protein
VANLVFTPIQFGLWNLPLAALDILVVRGAIRWMLVAIWPQYRWVAFAQGPYFRWVSIATVLQRSIARMNRWTSGVNVSEESRFNTPASTTPLGPRGTHDQPEAGAEKPDDHPQGNQFEHTFKGSGIHPLGGVPDQL